jgi:hypothetical protein
MPRPPTRMAAIGSPATGEVRPQDKGSALVEKEWVRRTRRRGELTERTLEGEQVEATFLDQHGQLRHLAGTVRRNEAGELVVESWADGVQKETAVPRDASVTRGSR